MTIIMTINIININNNIININNNIIILIYILYHVLGEGGGDNFEGVV